MKTPFIKLNFILLFFFISNSKEDICKENGEINISPLGKCRNLVNILKGKDLSMKMENLFYLAAHNGGKIEKHGYKLDIYKLNDTRLQSHKIRKSKLYIPDSCLEKMTQDSKLLLNKNKGIIIIVQDFNNLNTLRVVIIFLMNILSFFLIIRKPI